ncbi:hypothetical protein DL771_000748 [Monosporascus sp. 5C6A]|nr:hypothetical protein DL771_000748 [Monosporascus sp. 5C6A]
MYFSLFIFGFIYELILVYDALRLSNMIQIIGLCIYNLALLIYAAFQPGQLKESVVSLEGSLIMGKVPIIDPSKHVWPRIEPALLALIGVLAVGTGIVSFIAYKLHTEFAWLVYNIVHADIKMKRKVFALQIYVALVKFDFFFILGFLVQKLVSIDYITTDVEFGLSIAVIFIALLVTLLAIVFARNENKMGTITIVKTFPMLTVFATITIAMTVCTIIAAVLCLVHFNKGFKVYVRSQELLTHKIENDTDLRNTAYPVSQLLPQRMALD